MTLRHMRIFQEVYIKRSMTQAAKSLFMSQPSVSQAIKELETYYHTKFFERLSHQVSPTPAGETFYQYATQILSSFSQLNEALSDFDTKSPLCIGGNYTVGVSLIHSLLAQFEASYPNIPTRVFINKATVLKQMLRSNELDFAILEEGKEDPDFISIPYSKDKVVLTVSDTHPLANRQISLKELVKYPILLREAGVGSRELFLQKLSDAGFSIQPAWESISVLSITIACMDDRGIAVLPYQAAKPYLNSGALAQVYVKNLCLDRNLVLLYHKDKYVNTAMKEFFSICKQQ